MREIYKGEIKDFPKEIVDRMLILQEEQSGKKDLSVFEDVASASKSGGGFTWAITEEGDKFWTEVIAMKKFDVFFDKYPKRISFEKETACGYCATIVASVGNYNIVEVEDTDGNTELHVYNEMLYHANGNQDLDIIGDWLEKPSEIDLYKWFRGLGYDSLMIMYHRAEIPFKGIEEYKRNIKKVEDWWENTLTYREKVELFHKYREDENFI